MPLCGAPAALPAALLMSEGAFAVPLLGEVVLCPGLILSAVAKGGNMMAHLTHVIGHEIGHHFGNDINPFTNRRGPFSPLYRDFSACMSNRFRGITDQHVGEGVADFWGIAAVTESIRTMGRLEAFLFVKQSMQPLCGSPNDGLHPSGAFRINVLLGRHKGLRQVLGCRPTPSDKPRCTLQGKESGGDK